MQAPPSIIRLHWFPIEPTWIVSLGIIVLAALPHQIPVPIAFGLRTPLGAFAFGLLSVAALWKKPVLGMAMMILLVATWMSNYIEGFSTNITKDKIYTKKRWLSEEIMHEEPTFIQERTEQIILNDEVQDMEPWMVEETLGEHPSGIQERPVLPIDMQETSQSHRH
jgi:hypothetical protein